VLFVRLSLRFIELLDRLLSCHFEGPSTLMRETIWALHDSQFDNQCPDF
jgi:hypothetical protein